MRRLVASFVLSCLAGAALADERPPPPPEKWRECTVEFMNRDYEAAIDCLRLAYEVNPVPAILFAWAQAERLSGDCPSAVVLYERFLATKPERPEHVVLATDNLEKCRKALGTTVEPVKVEPVDAAPRPPPPPPPPREATPRAIDEPPRAARGRGPWPYALIAGGAVALGVGGVFFGLSSADVSDAESAATWQDYDDSIARAKERRTIAFVSMGIGSALAIGGAILWFAHDGSSEESTRAAIWIDGSSTGISFVGRW